MEFKPQFRNKTVGESAADAAAGETLVDEVAEIASSFTAEPEAAPVF